MNKQKLGRIIFYCSLALSVIMMVTIFILVTTLEMGVDEAWRLRYITVFFALNISIVFGSLIKEYCDGNYTKEKYKLKVIIASVFSLLGTLIIFLLPTVLSAQIIVLCGLVVVFYVLNVNADKSKKKETE